MKYSRLADRLRRAILALPNPARERLGLLLMSFAAALMSVLFMLAVEGFYAFVYLRQYASLTEFLLVSLAVMLASSLAAGLLLARCPDAAGSGVPQAKLAYWKDMGHIPLRTVMYRFAAGVLSLGGGTSLGREGPSIFLSSGIASTVGGLFGMPKHGRRRAVAFGAAAGLAAAFNTPLAAITFIIEELVGDSATRRLGPVVIAVLIGALSVHALIGNQPAFSLPALGEVGWYHYLVVPLVATSAAAAGLLFQSGALALRNHSKRRRRIPRWLLPVIGGLFTWAIAAFVFSRTGRLGIFSLGYHDLSTALHGGILWQTAGILVAGKLIATIVSYGFGGSGGIFSPMLFLGGLTGTFFAGLSGLFLPLTASDHIVLAIVGMSACLGAVLKAPLTATLIVFEMTHRFSVVPGLLLGTIISQYLARRFGPRKNFYDLLLEQDGHDLVRLIPPQDLQGWQNMPVAGIMNRSPSAVRRLDPAQLARLLERRPYSRFPYLVQGKPRGVITREAIRLALAAGTEPAIETPVIRHPDQTVAEIAEAVMQSPSQLVLLADRTSGRFLGLLTLHDLLRAQTAVLEDRE